MYDINAFSNVWLQSQQALFGEWMANYRRIANIPYFIERSKQIKKGISPSEVVYEIDRVKVLHYKAEHEPKYKTPLLFVFALVNRPYILDLKKGKSVISHFVQRGFDTYLVDWGVPTHSDRHQTLDDYINGYLEEIVDFLCERTGSDKTSVLGYCMGGTMSAMYTSLHQERVKNLIMLAAAVDFSTREGMLNLWGDAKYFDVDKFVDTMGNCPADILQASFLMLKPVQNLIEKPLNLFEKLDDDAYIEDYLAMEGWLNDNIPVPGEVFREFIKYLYQQNLLTRGEMPVGRHTINLRNITCPILNLMANKDDLVPCSQSMPFNELVGSTDKQLIDFPAGHIGLAVGTKAQRELWPKVCDWLAKRSEPMPASAKKKAAA